MCRKQSKGSESGDCPRGQSLLSDPVWFSYRVILLRPFRLFPETTREALRRAVRVALFAAAAIFREVRRVRRMALRAVLAARRRVAGLGINAFLALVAVAAKEPRVEPIDSATATRASSA